MLEANLRLECLKLVLAHAAEGEQWHIQDVVKAADIFYQFILTGEPCETLVE
jgi:hypothetical protein